MRNIGELKMRLSIGTLLDAAGHNLTFQVPDSNCDEAELYLNGTFFFDICFHDTVPVLLPVAYAIFICIPYLLYIARNKKPIAHFFRRRRAYGPVQPMKLILCLCYLGVCIAEAIFAGKLIFGEQMVIAHVVFRTSVGFVVSIFLIAATIMETKRDIPTSTCLFVFWSLLLIVNGLRMTVAIIQSWHASHPSDVAFGATIVTMTIVLLQIALYGFIGAKTGNKPLEEEASQTLGSQQETPLTPHEEDMKKFDFNPPSPEGNTSVVSRLTYSWLTSFVWKGWRRPIQPHDIYQLPYSELTCNLAKSFRQSWSMTLKSPKENVLKVAANDGDENTDDETINKDISTESATTSGESKRPVGVVIRALLRSFGPLFFFSGLIKLGQDIMVLSQPVLMMLLIAYLKDYAHRPLWMGYSYAAGFLLFGILNASLLQRYFYFMAITSLRFRASLGAAIFEKSLRLTNAARQLASTGEILNLIASDTTNFLQMTTSLHLVWSVPLQVAAVIFLLWLNLGAAAFAGVALIVVTMLMSGIMARLAKRFQFAKLKIKDERIKLINETLMHMKTVKVYAWEEAMQAKIEQAREEELSFHRKATILSVFSQIIWFIAPLGVAVLSFGTYLSLNPEANIDPQQAFVSLVLINFLRFAMVQLPHAIIHTVQYLVSLKRIGSFLMLDELDPLSVVRETAAASLSFAVRIRNGTFSWAAVGIDEDDGDSSKPVLSDINLTVKRGQLVGVIGEIGSGKSSLLSAILGEMRKTSGSLSVFGKIAYLPQTPWILNATVKENILFSSTEDFSYYRQVLEACALKPDLEMLPGGESSEIGERGANLSGGQKQRIALARAIYAKSDIYLFDDTLSAVDSYTAQHLFDKVIGPNGLLAANQAQPATRIWVTHKLNFLTRCDHIVYMAGGRILAQGSFEHLLATCPAFADLTRQHVSGTNRRQSSSAAPDSGTKVRRSSLLDTKLDGTERLTEAEKVAEGAVGLKVYGSYFKAMGVALFVLYVISMGSAQAIAIVSHNSLSRWTMEVAINATAALPFREKHYQLYAMISTVQACFMLLSNIFLGVSTFRASRSLHAGILKNIMRTAIHFFETTPVSRIINRFSKDVDTVDSNLADLVMRCTATLFMIVATYVVVAFKLPISLFLAVPLLVLAIFLQRIYAASIRQLKRIELASQSPILSHFSETLAGVSSIRAYERQKNYTETFGKLMDENHASYYASQVTTCWLLVRTEIVGIMLVFMAAMIGVVQRESLDPSAVAFAMAYSMSIGFALFWSMQNASLLEASIVSVERLNEYNDAPKDQPWLQPEDKSSDMARWPQEGSILFDDVVFTYREGLEPALRHVSFSIRPREKVGIIGRTGAGKTSLATVLLRISDLTTGKILIDGVDISQIGLHTLRKAITPIPQDPVLFSGTLRFNLDPFGKHPDTVLKRVLELVHLKNLGDLDQIISEGGENFSAGQRQLICLARALLRRPADSSSGTHILLMDEATAAVDTATDKLVSEMIRREFRDFTVLTIAHRLETVLSYDRVLVMAEGQVLEFDTPSFLLNDTSSYLHMLAKSSGLI